MSGFGPNARHKGTKRPCSGCIDFQMHVAVKPLPQAYLVTGGRETASTSDAKRCVGRERFAARPGFRCGKLHFWFLTQTPLVAAFSHSKIGGDKRESTELLPLPRQGAKFILKFCNTPFSRTNL